MGGYLSLHARSDAGETWGPARLVPSVIGVTCQGSIAAAGPAAVAKGRVLLSAPYSHDLSGYLLHSIRLHSYSWFWAGIRPYVSHVKHARTDGLIARSRYALNGRENMAVWSYRLNSTNTGPSGPDPEPRLVARLYPCKAAYSSFLEDGSLNLFEGVRILTVNTSCCTSESVCAPLRFSGYVYLCAAFSPSLSLSLFLAALVYVIAPRVLELIDSISCGRARRTDTRQSCSPTPPN
jgi:hypothetical protein